MLPTAGVPLILSFPLDLALAKRGSLRNITSATAERFLYSQKSLPPIQKKWKCRCSTSVYSTCDRGKKNKAFVQNLSIGSSLKAIASETAAEAGGKYN
jgi:hypothetical protein